MGYHTFNKEFTKSAGQLVNYDFSMWIILKGTGIIEEKKANIYKFSPGDCFIFRPWKTYLRTNQPPLKLAYIHYNYINNHYNIILPDKVKKIHKHFHEKKPKVDINTLLQTFLKEIELQSSRDIKMFMLSVDNSVKKQEYLRPNTEN